MNARKTTLETLARRIVMLERGRPVRVAIDGRTASGKTTLADELAEAARGLGRTVIRASVDGFHRPRAERHRRGRHSADGYYEDARDLGAFRRDLLDPLGPGGDRRYRTASLDLDTNAPVNEPPIIAAADAVLIVDGTFLQRPELAGCWEAVIFVEVGEAAAARRGVTRDAAAMGQAMAERLYAERYQPAYLKYEAACAPALSADAVLINEDFSAPRLRFREGGGALIRAHP